MDIMHTRQLAQTGLTGRGIWQREWFSVQRPAGRPGSGGIVSKHML